MNLAARVLLVEDNPGHARLFSKLLSSCKGRIPSDVAPSLAEAIERLKSTSYDVVVSDLGLSDSCGSETIEAIRRACPEIPIIALTSLDSPEMAKGVLALGAQDYLVKDTLAASDCGAELLERAIHHAMLRHETSREHQRLLTQLQNRDQLLERKNRRLAKLYRTAQRVVENVSHEFRTPLTVIREYVALMLDGLVDPVTDEQARMLMVVGDRAEDLNRMVDDMLDVSKLDAGMLTVQRRPCDVRQIVQSVWPALERKASLRQVQLSLELEPGLPEVYCDASKVERILVNLAVNAVKFCGADGRVRMFAKHDARAKQVVLGVSDDGPGIGAEDRATIFDRFTQVESQLGDNSRGFGLGLSIVKEMAELNLGAVSLETAPGRGCTFTCTLPVADLHEVSQRYLRQRIAKAENSEVSLLLAEPGEPAAPRVFAELESLLNHIVRADDLVLRMDESWLVILAGDADAAARFSNRVARGRRDTNRNCMQGPLPELRMELLGSWDLRDDLPRLKARLDEVLRSREAVLA